jgi:FtsP/CotA-like multicopper oxidase with cupredoxin domain
MSTAVAQAGALGRLAPKSPRVLTLNGSPPPATHAGSKNTVVVPAGGTAQMIMNFADHTGKYVFHCHVLEHEDHMMMASFQVTS